jgi:hypothetical protein
MILAIHTDLPVRTHKEHALYSIAMNDELNRYAEIDPKLNLVYNFPVLIPNPALIFESEEDEDGDVEKTALVHPDNDFPRELTRQPFKDIDDKPPQRQRPRSRSR